MRQRSKSNTASHLRLLTRTVYVVLGAALLIWGFTPAVIDRMATEEVPPMSVLLRGGFSFAMGAGLLYAAYCLPSRRGLLLGGCLSGLLFVSGSLTIFVLRTGVLFPVVLSALGMVLTVQVWRIGDDPGIKPAWARIRRR